MINRPNNHQDNPPPNEADRHEEQAFLRLGTILAEIADNLEKKESEKGAERDSKIKPG